LYEYATTIKEELTRPPSRDVRAERYFREMFSKDVEELFKKEAVRHHLRYLLIYWRAQLRTYSSLQTSLKTDTLSLIEGLRLPTLSMKQSA
jgi:hypothetical protein